MSVVVQAIWEDFLKVVHEEVGSRVVETWFKAVVLLRWDAHHKVVYLQVPNSFVKEWLSTHYVPLFESHLGRLLNEKTVHVSFSIAREVPTVQRVETPITVAVSPASSVPLYRPARPMGRSVEAEKHAGHVTNLYQFDTFVVGPSNSLAYAAAIAVAQKPGGVYNPFFMYGGSGLGKTHLLHAIGNKIKETSSHIRVLYQSADRFVQEFIYAIRNNKMLQFEAKYKNIDVLLVDDIQFIANKEQTQEAFFHIFNALHQAGKQIVFTSDSMPHDIAGLAERMRSRLEWGLVADIHLPTLETRMAIVHKKALLHHEELSDEVAHYIASRSINNIRELEGALIRVIACASLAREPISIALAQKVLGEVPEKKQRQVDFQRIAGIVGKYFNYTVKELRAAQRNKEIALARHIALYFMKKLTDKSLREIGAFLGRKDHSTVLHACEKIEQARNKDESFNRTIQHIEADILKE